nr:related to MRD1 [Neurospora crassa]
MESSSRIFVKNLPPTITEAEFRKHFSAEGRQVTDVKLIPARHIGFVGYKSAEDAARAVKYFNRSFIRMSRISVDIAKPIADSKPQHKSPSKGSSKDADPKNAPKVLPPNTKVTAAAVPKVEAAPDAPKRKLDVLDEADPKLQEYLDVMGAHPSKKMRNAEGLPTTVDEVLAPAVPAGLEDGESDDEYEDIPSRTHNQSHTADQEMVDAPLAASAEPSESAPPVSLDATDDDWLRSRTNRLLDLVDPEDAAFALRPAASGSAAVSVPSTSVENTASAKPEEHPAEDSREMAATSTHDPESAISLIEKTSRLFLRNLSYTVTEDDVREHFAKFGILVEVHVPLDSKGHSKGFAMIRYEKPASALAAFQTDGTVFQGRIVHILPAAAKRENKLDEFALSKLPLKKQQLLRKKAEAASSTFNWNSLFMSQDAVNTAMAERLGVSKAELLDPTDACTAVKQAVAETTVIQEAKQYFAANGVNIEAFKTQQRGDTTILVKNIKNTTIEELRTLFEEHGTVLRVLMPPSGTIAIVQFAQPVQCRTAFARKAYSRFKDSVLFLEKGPKVSLPIMWLYPLMLVLPGLTDAFKHLDGFVQAKVKTKTDPKKPGQVLSMGFGFVAFRTKDQAQAALKVMDGQVLDAHKISVKASHRGLDAAEERRREDMAKKAANQGTKLVVKNLPFEVTKKEVRTLFSAYGKLVALRIPKKFNQSSRGFAFAEFSTAKEALNAFNSLKDTHILGRRLVIDFAQAEDIDPEDQIAAMEKKTRAQVNKVALQQLTGTGRAKVTIGDNDEDEV